MNLNEQSVNVELDTSRNQNSMAEDQHNKDQSFTVDNKIETLEDIETNV